MHLMIDLETLGTASDCVVTQIGYVLFDEIVINFSGRVDPDPKNQILLGRSVTWETIAWWLQQEEAARKQMVENQGRMVGDCLQEFIQDIAMHCGWENVQGVWAHGTHFDVSIMENLF